MTTAYFEIQGYIDDDELVTEPCWHPLFQYKDELYAKGLFKYLFDAEDLPKYLDQYQDFRLVPVKARMTAQERRARRRRRQARLEAQNAAKARSGADKGPKKARRKRSKEAGQ